MSSHYSIWLSILLLSLLMLACSSDPHAPCILLAVPYGCEHILTYSTDPHRVFSQELSAQRVGLYLYNGKLQLMNNIHPLLPHLHTATTIGSEDVQWNNFLPSNSFFALHWSYSDEMPPISQTRITAGFSDDGVFGGSTSFDLVEGRVYLVGCTDWGCDLNQYDKVEFLAHLAKLEGSAVGPFAELLYEWVQTGADPWMSDALQTKRKVLDAERELRKNALEKTERKLREAEAKVQMDPNSSNVYHAVGALAYWQEQSVNLKNVESLLMSEEATELEQNGIENALKELADERAKNTAGWDEAKLARMQVKLGLLREQQQAVFSQKADCLEARANIVSLTHSCSCKLVQLERIQPMWERLYEQQQQSVDVSASRLILIEEGHTFFDTFDSEDGSQLVEWKTQLQWQSLYETAFEKKLDMLSTIVAEQKLSAITEMTQEDRNRADLVAVDEVLQGIKMLDEDNKKEEEAAAKLANALEAVFGHFDIVHIREDPDEPPSDSMEMLRLVKLDGRCCVYTPYLF
eukprot:GHVS01006851.1.p1 GENE.GHVS01006851.1~~GHVS01006851.1.p1  ORF type:complete len:519 (+),score=69.68 GHVS01006851.1:351-1907(+)